MSKVSIRGNPNGSGEFSIEAPNSNVDRTLALPDEDGTLVTFDENGNLLVGSTDPASKLVVDSNIDNGVIATFRGDDGGGGRVLEISSLVSEGFANAGYDFNAASTIGFLSFSTTNVEGMRLDKDGNFQFNSGYGSVATAYGCRAWVNFNSRSANTIRDSGNVSSITDSGTGIQTVNFATAMPDNDYAVSFYMKYDGGDFNDVGILGQDITQTSSASSFPFFTWRDGGDTGLHDFREVHISFFR